MKSIVLVTLLAIAVIAVVGCGHSPTAQTAATSAGSATTQAKASSTTAAAANAASRENPVALGMEAQVGDWTIKVMSANPNANTAVQGAIGYQDPAAGNQYVLVNLEATYNGDNSNSFITGLIYQIVGTKGNTFPPAEIGIDSSIEDTNEVYKGASLSGPLVFEVPSDQVDSAVLEMASTFSFDDSAYFALK
jgi:hypothetical protein